MRLIKVVGYHRTGQVEMYCTRRKKGAKCSDAVSADKLTHTFKDIRELYSHQNYTVQWEFSLSK